MLAEKGLLSLFVMLTWLYPVGGELWRQRPSLAILCMYLMYDSELGTLEVIWQTVATKLVPLFCLCGNSGRGERGNAVLSCNTETARWLLCYLCNQCKVLPCNRENEHGGNWRKLMLHLKVLKHLSLEEVNPSVDCDCPQVAWWGQTTKTLSFFCMEDWGNRHMLLSQ